MMIIRFSFLILNYFCIWILCLFVLFVFFGVEQKNKNKNKKTSQNLFHLHLSDRSLLIYFFQLCLQIGRERGTGLLFQLISYKLLKTYPICTQ